MSASISLSSPDVLLVRYGELALKKGNRRMFERALADNIRQATRISSPVVVELQSGRMTVIPERRSMDVARRIQDVFGIKSVSPAWSVPNNPDEIVEVARALFNEALAEHPTDRPVTCRVRTRRAEKRFPIPSSDFDRYVAERILPGPERVKVQLVDPELELGIEIRGDKSYLFHQRLAGPGGLPVGTLGRTLCLLSGGIDSPVAAWLTMKRGCHVSFVSFHSAPYIGEGSKKKVVDLARSLARYQNRSRVYVVPFAAIQKAIKESAPESYRTVLYRRMMQRIASRLAKRHAYQAVVTGESMGQVASQTLENMTCIGAASEVPVLRPLLSFDKEETILIARRIGTFDISARPEPDCCTVFQPRRPVIRGTLAACKKAEADLDVEGLTQRASDDAEIILVEEE